MKAALAVTCMQKINVHLWPPSPAPSKTHNPWGTWFQCSEEKTLAVKVLPKKKGLTSPGEARALEVRLLL